MACFVVGELVHHDRRRGRTVRFPPQKSRLFIQLSSKKRTLSPPPLFYNISLCTPYYNKNNWLFYNL